MTNREIAKQYLDGLVRYVTADLDKLTADLDAAESRGKAKERSEERAASLAHVRRRAVNETRAEAMRALYGVADEIESGAHRAEKGG
jgi:hypothetical protein